MPQGEGGSLSDGQYLDVTAYLLERNGYAAGNQELTSDVAVLSAVTIRPGAAVGRVVFETLPSSFEESTACYRWGAVRRKRS